MTITRVGTSAKYANGWDAAFSKGKKSKATAAVSKKKAPAKKAKKSKK